MVGTARHIANQMQEWLEAEGADGFNVMFPWLPGGLDAFKGRSCLNFSGAASFDANMKAARCARTWACRVR